MPENFPHNHPFHFIPLTIHISLQKTRQALHHSIRHSFRLYLQSQLLKAQQPSPFPNHPSMNHSRP